MRITDLTTTKKPDDPILQEIIDAAHPFEFKSFGRAVLTLFIGTVYIAFVFDFLVFMSPLLPEAPWVRYILYAPYALVVVYFYAVDRFFGFLVSFLPDPLITLVSVIFVISLPIAYFIYIYIEFTLINWLQYQNEHGKL